ncbi:hypothetical protein apy_14880 [Aeropyrum pernix]|uniref:Uncharacterized protein n=1 Tax=Aeropyrum pernix TaxID=56636 RepID=A0A401HBF2_AERPX|nr:hypothetical protein [Aeropyrum pernix]GBF09763.1 hypothetical protein apy_14880 [Aeropyrum pernix]
MSGENGKGCRPSRDFLRYIANRVIARYAAKLPASVVEDIRDMLGRGEDKYRFSIYGGDPRNIVKYFDSEEWRDLVEYAANTGALSMLMEILDALAAEYRRECPEVAEAAEREVERLKAGEEKLGRREELSLERIYRMLSLAGYRVESKDGTLEVDEGLIKLIIKLEGQTLEYTICKSGRSKTLEGVLSKLSKIREL